jgi:O-antigen/teichoic acid export membrane protein
VVIRHSLLYFLGRIIPGAISLLTLSVYTRLLTTDQYGHYSLVIAAAGFISAVCFQWLSLSLGRYLPAHADKPQELLSTALTGYLMLIFSTGVLGCAVAWLWPDTSLRGLIAIAVVIGWGQAWFDLNLRIVNTRLSPIRYGVVSSIKAVAALGLGAALFYSGMGVVGVLLGLLVSLFVAPSLIRQHWYGVSVHNYSSQMLKAMLSYGAPLTVTFLMDLILGISDRFLLGWFINAKAVGAYAAAYDLTQYSLGMLTGVIHLAAFPLALRALEEKGTAAAQNQLKQNVLLLLAISIPATCGLVILANNISAAVLGPEFRNGAGHIIAIVALAIFVGGVKSYYFDYSFQLGHKVAKQVVSVVWAASANVVLNLGLIPRYGALGAAYSTLVAFVVGLLASWRLGRKAFILPPVPKEAYKIVLASIGMAVSLLPTLNWHGRAALAGQVLLGTAIYLMLLFILDAGRCRLKLTTQLHISR